MIAIDFETLSLEPYVGGLRLIQTKRPGEAVRITDCFELGIEKTRLFLRELLADEWLAHNAKFESAWCYEYVKQFPRIVCTYRASKVLVNGYKHLKCGLWDVVKRQLPEVALNETDMQVSDWSGPLSAEQIAYAAQDVEHLFPLWESLAKDLQDTAAMAAYQIDCDVIPAEIQMERQGICIDIPLWQKLAHQAEVEYAVDMGTLEQLENSEINLASPKQVQALLASWGVVTPQTRWNKGGSTSTLALVPYSTNPLVKALLDARKNAKKVSSYGQKWLEKFVKSGKAYTHLSPYTETGRYASSKPNLQQVPRDGRYRGAFVAAEGKVLVGADYSAVELRLAALLAAEGRMLTAFKEGRDVHKHTSTLLFNIPYDTVTKGQRQVSKALSFGLLYGMGAEKLQLYARQGYGVRLSLQEASDLRTKFFGVYPAIRKWQGTESKKGELLGYASTPVGRRRYLPRDSYTQYLNTQVQGFAADIMKTALIALSERRPAGVELLLTVHDEVLLECSPDKVGVAKALLQSCMVEATEGLTGKGLLAIETKHGRSWGESH